MAIKIEEIKSSILRWQDFYGSDIPDTNAIRKAKTKDELKKVLNQHKRLMEDTLCDAIQHLENFEKELGL